LIIVLVLAQLWGRFGRRFFGHYVRFLKASQKATLEVDQNDADVRKPAVYLRPFSIDNTNLKLALDHEAAKLRGRLERMDDTISIEEIVAEVFLKTHRMVAIGNPGEILSPLGAKRIFTDAWESEVRKQLECASLVVIMLGDSPGISWELKAVIEANKLPCTIIVVPPTLRNTAKQIWRNWAAVLRNAGAFCAELPDLARLVLFSSRKSSRFVTFSTTTANSPDSFGEAEIYFCVLRHVAHILNIRSEDIFFDIEDDLELSFIDNDHKKMTDGLGFVPPTATFTPPSNSFDPPTGWRGE
jgi:hypothetical protein